MSNLLNAANSNPDKFIMGELPVNSGDVSIMTVKELFDSLKTKTGQSGDIVYDSGTAEYYVYGITGDNGINSTVDNLQSVGLDWYKQKHKSIATATYWPNAGDSSHSVFGGQLYYVQTVCDKSYEFGWYCSRTHYDFVSYKEFWGSCVTNSVYVAVVHE